MASGTYSRIDNKRNSSSYCSTVTVVVFVALCLVGIWLMTSSSIVPVQNAEEISQDYEAQVKQQATAANNASSPRKSEENSGHLREDTSKRDSDAISSQNESNLISQESQEGNTEVKRGGKSDGDAGAAEGLKGESRNSTVSGDDDSREENKGSNPETERTKTDGGEDNWVYQRNDSANLDEKKSASDEGQEKTDLDDSGTKSVKVDDTENNSDDKYTETKQYKENSETRNSNEDAAMIKDEESAEKKKDEEDSETTTEKKDIDTKPGDDFGEMDREKSDGQVGELNPSENDKNSSASMGRKEDSQATNQTLNDVFPSGSQSELLNETVARNGSFSTQATESRNEKEAQLSSKPQSGFNWKVCNTTADPDYIPCLDNLQAIKSLRTTKHYEHRERHCPQEPPTCLVPLPVGYKKPIEWPTSRDKIWYNNVPHTELATIKGHQNWVKVTGEYLSFPGGGTQFKNGALHYIDFIQESVPSIAWGKRSRVVLDVGCGVASFGGYLFDRDVLTMSLAPKDEHEAQVQFALERGIPAISAVMGTQRLPFPGGVFDIVHCARCRVPWHIEGGKLLLELNRLLRPGGFFIWSATPVYQKLPEDIEIWKEMSDLIKKMCWELVSINKDKINRVGVATYKKPTSNECYQNRSAQEPPLCADSDDPNAAWNVPLQACMHKLPVDAAERGSQWPEQWPARLEKPPYWLSNSQIGVYSKPAPKDFASDYQHWKRVVSKLYMKGLGINWSSVRNVMDMRAVYGGFAAALRDLNVWVMNVVPIDSADTLPIIYERGLFGIYHDWCESFSTYPRSYDLLHADHLFSTLKKSCNLVAVMAEVDRMLRPEGKLIVRDQTDTLNLLETMVRYMNWDIRMTYANDKEGLLFVQKSLWRPTEAETLAYAIS